MKYLRILGILLITILLISFIINPAQADPWANAVVGYYNLGEGLPENTIGQTYPGPIPANWQDYAVRINPGGYLILDMGEGEEISDLPDNDFYVEEVDTEDSSSFGNDPYSVFVSQDANNWFYLGQGSGDTQFDLNGVLLQARYLKIEGIQTHSEIDGVGILYHVPNGWYKGNTHTHSNLSDGDSPPATVAAHYLNLGYDFLVLTDHNLISDFYQYSTNNYLCIDGEEITHSTNHINGIGLNFTISPSSNLQANVNAVLAQGSVPHLNHPSWGGYPLAFVAADIIPVDGLCHMEIFNALTNDNDEDIWDSVLTSGKLVYGIASDDCHQLYAQSGRGWIIVRSNVLSLEAIQEALNAGDYYASSGIILNDYHIDSDQMIVDSQNGDLIEFIGPNGQILKSVAGPYGYYHFTGKDRLFNPREYYVRARVTNNLAKYAWTQPRFVPDPYADAVVSHTGIPAGSPYYTLGPPYEGKVPSDWAQYGARIPAGGSLILDMGKDEEITDRKGADLYIEEIDNEDGVGVDDVYHVYASVDMLSWVYLGQGSGDAYFDLAGMLDKARYIRLEVTQGDAEIDGAEANFIDAFADWVIDYAGMSMGHPRYVLGPPYPGVIPAPWEDYSVRIDVGGYLTLDLGPGEEAVDGPGYDIYIEEVDEEDGASFTSDPYTVYGSKDRIHWVKIGTGAGDAHFDLYGHMDWLRYLRLEPIDTNIEIDGIHVKTVGFNWCKGDFDGDNDIDGSDLAVFAADFGRIDCDPGDPCEGDFDKDNDIDGSDLAIFAVHFGRTDCP